MPSQRGREEVGDSFYVGNWAKHLITIPIFKHKKTPKGLLTFDFIALNQNQISSFPVRLRDLTICSEELQNAASGRPMAQSLQTHSSEGNIPVGRRGSVSLATAPAAHSFH